MLKKKTVKFDTYYSKYDNEIREGILKALHKSNCKLVKVKVCGPFIYQYCVTIKTNSMEEYLDFVTTLSKYCDGCISHLSF